MLTFLTKLKHISVISVARLGSDNEIHSLVVQCDEGGESDSFERGMPVEEVCRRLRDIATRLEQRVKKC